MRNRILVSANNHTSFIGGLMYAEITKSLCSFSKKTSLATLSKVRRTYSDRRSETLCKGKVNLMETILKLAELRAHGRCPNPPVEVQSSQTKSANFADRLLIVMDTLIYELIVVLKEKLEAPSIGEVVRQAVRAYAIELASNGSVDDADNFRAESYTGDLKKLNIRVPSSTKERLEFLKDLTGATYTAIIFAGLGILARSTDEQESVLRTLTQKEFNHEHSDTRRSSVSVISDRKTAIHA